MTAQQLPITPAVDITVDLVVVGAGTGLAAALAGHELGLDTMVVEKTAYVGGSTARSGGAFWIPANPILAENGVHDTVERAAEYIEAVVDGAVPPQRWRAFLDHGTATIELLRRTTPMTFQWDEGYSDYHPEEPGGSAAGRTCECRPFDARVLGAERARLRPGVVEAPLPMPVTGADYKWMNLMARKPGKAFPKIARRMAQGIGGLALGREYVAGGQALAAGLYAGILRAKIPVWTETSVVDLITDGDRVTGVVVEQGGARFTVTARRGVILAAGGFDHDLAMRHEFQTTLVTAKSSFGSPGNTGDAIKQAQALGADLTLMDQSWWFPAVAALPGADPQVLLAERSLPGSLMIDQEGRRFINEATDYMTFGQRVMALEDSSTPVTQMWLVFDQQYRNSYVLAGALFPRMAIPDTWYDAGIAHRGSSVSELAASMGVSQATLQSTIARFNTLAAAGTDDDFQRGASAYDRYYGDPTVTPNPNLRPLEGTLYAVQVILGDLGTCGGIRADGHGRALRADETAIEGLYAIGNAAGNAFGRTYPGAGATIGQGLVYGLIAARHAAASPVVV